METMPSALEYMVRESHIYFAHSTVRLAAYKELYNSMLEDHDSDKLEPPKLLSLSPTRWLAVYDCIEGIQKTSANYVVPEEMFRQMTANYSGAYSIY
ncbi:hypothetical protein HPB52_000057 [Rhipicephalus sanguineus]|uniref:Uncharacterized protein n=1 Tax=Rhipicephalus sanguineus TaxID=34632 RepID=A0A9D4PAT4_RHISA|nr:hypothetical protein HPB52_000057 [Rhipicephalus sanguineus]